MKIENLRDFIKSANELAILIFGLLSIGIFIGTMVVLEGETNLPAMMKNIIAISGIIIMVAATSLCVAIRHLKGRVYNFKNAPKGRIVIYILFNILFTMLFVWMAFINPYDIFKITIFAVTFYLGTLLSFKYLVVKEHYKDHSMAIILIYLILSVILVFKYVQMYLI